MSVGPGGRRRVPAGAAWYERNAYAAALAGGTPGLAAFAQRLPPGALILDAGCGMGVDARHLVELGFRVVGLDASARMLRGAAARPPPAAFVQGDLAAVPVATASVDALLAAFSLIHVPKANAPGALAELARVLRPGGVALFVLEHGPPHEVPGPPPVNIMDEPEARRLLAPHFDSVEAAVEASGGAAPFEVLRIVARRRR